MIRWLTGWGRPAAAADEPRTPTGSVARDTVRRPRDSQRSAVYTWERRLPGWPGDGLTLAGCQQLVCRVWGEHLRSVAPRVTDGRGRRSACYAFSSHQIRLPRRARSRYVVLHEIAHGILGETDPGVADHGPEFARLYLSLLYRHAGVSLSRARSLAVHQRPRRVHFARLAEVPAPLPAGQRRPATVTDAAGEPLLF